MTDPHFPLLDLPTELVLRIIVNAASSSSSLTGSTARTRHDTHHTPLNSKHTALCLSLVSSPIRRLAAPTLYETVVLRSERQVGAFARVLRRYAECSHSEVEDWTWRNGMDAKMRIEPRVYVRRLSVMYHAFATFSIDLESKHCCEHPYATIFRECNSLHLHPYPHLRSFPQPIHSCSPRTSHLTLQATFLHSSVVPFHPVHGMIVRELEVLGPVFASDWARIGEVVGRSGFCDVRLRGTETTRGSGASSIAGTRGNSINGNRRNEEDKTFEAGSRHVHIQIAQGPYHQQHQLFSTFNTFSSPSLLLANLTHLRLSEPLSSPHVSAQIVVRLPSLTHLAVPVREPAVYTLNRVVEDYGEGVWREVKELLEYEEEVVVDENASGSKSSESGSDSPRTTTKRVLRCTRLHQLVLLLDFRTWTWTGANRAVCGDVKGWVRWAGGRERRLCVLEKRKVEKWDGGAMGSYEGENIWEYAWRVRKIVEAEGEKTIAV